MKSQPKQTGRIRCAIYTRVSIDQGLRSSGSGLAVMQPINLGSGEDPILDLGRCDALSRLGQIVQRDHCIAQRWAINQYVAVYERRWLACVGIDLSSSPLMCCP
jgi:hypothetical protein